MSYNETAYAHWAKASRAKRALQRDLELLLLAARDVPRPIPGDRLTATATIAFSVRRRRDEGNFRTPLEKALGDALTNGGWLSDDTPDHYRFAGLTFVHEPGAQCTRIALNWGGAA